MPFLSVMILPVGVFLTFIFGISMRFAGCTLPQPACLLVAAILRSGSAVHHLCFYNRARESSPLLS